MKLTTDQINEKLAFIDTYVNACNPATASEDPNANVDVLNLATLKAEINKDIDRQVNRALVSNKIEEKWGPELAVEYNRQLNAGEIYTHDETSIFPYCASISMYPYLIHGTTGLKGISEAPKHLRGFTGSFPNFMYNIASSFAGAVASVEFLMYFDYFARKEWGETYLETSENKAEIAQHFQSIVYSMNQPAGARGFQSIFWNISIFDEHYFTSLFGNDFRFPDGSSPTWNTLNLLQQEFLSWFNAEREKKVLTFPVVTVAMLVDGEKPLDADFEEVIAKEMSEGNAFFVYQSESADSLASCCRLRNELVDNTFSYSLGAGGTSTGSVNVITINFNRLVQDGRDLATEIDKIHKYQLAYREIIANFIERGMLSVYDEGFITLDKQFLTIGINGMVEGAEFLGMKATNNPEYKEWIASQLKIIYDKNKAIKAETGVMFNTEFVPAENLGVKNARKDRADGYDVSRDCYNSYFYAVEDEDITPIDKFHLHGNEIIKWLDGGSALHLNLDEALSKENAKNVLRLSAKHGCNYFCTNIKSTICNSCGFINKETHPHCTKCGSTDIDYATRVIGYLKKESAFSKDRQIEAEIRHYH